MQPKDFNAVTKN